jgi:hypothetical protein
MYRRNCSKSGGKSTYIYIPTYSYLDRLFTCARNTYLKANTANTNHNSKHVEIRMLRQSRPGAEDWPQNSEQRDS